MKEHAGLQDKTLVVPGLLNKLTIRGFLWISPRRLAIRISRRMMDG
jgi:hypothetical protein